MQGIYKITNIKNQKCYIGQSKDIESREKTHFRDLSKGRHHSHKFQDDFDKYGIDSFEFEILEIINDADLLSFCEGYYIDKFNTVLDGYNISYPKCFYDKKSSDKKEISINDINYLQTNFPFVHISKDLLQDIDDGLVIEEFSNSFSLLINFFKVAKKQFNEISIEVKYKKLKSSKKEF